MPGVGSSSIGSSPDAPWQSKVPDDGAVDDAARIRKGCIKARPSIPIIMMPCTIPISLRLRCMSPLRIWLNSWAMTPCSSSRVRILRQPGVTPMTASLGVKPAANALMPLSLRRRKTAGTAVPLAIAISSTTLSSRRSARSCDPGSTGSTPSKRTMPLPPALKQMILPSVPRSTIPSTIPLTQSSRCRLYQPWAFLT